MYRVVLLLAGCQALMMSANSLIVSSAPLVGHDLAQDKALATLPLAIQFLASMIMTIPAAHLMRRIGRRNGFRLGASMGLTAALVAALSIQQQYYWGFLMAALLFGGANGFASYYRFAAAESVDGSRRSLAISWVLAGGVLAAFVGPNLASQTRHLLAQPFAASYASLSLVFALSLVLLMFVRVPAATEDHGAAASRPLREIVTQLSYVTALLAAVLGYTIMAFIMSATPLAMAHHNHVFDDTAFVIQWHLFGMFAPSFFTGHLIRRVGVLWVMLGGALIAACCVAINLAGTTVWHFWLALLLLGVSWNFLFVGGTTLLTETYRPSERARAQSFNDFFVFVAVAASALGAGIVHDAMGWRVINLFALPFIGIIVLAVLASVHLQRRNKRIEAGQPG